MRFAWQNPRISLTFYTPDPDAAPSGPIPKREGRNRCYQWCGGSDMDITGDRTATPCDQRTAALSKEGRITGNAPCSSYNCTLNAPTPGSRSTIRPQPARLAPGRNLRASISPPDGENPIGNVGRCADPAQRGRVRNGVQMCRVNCVTNRARASGKGV